MATTKFGENGSQKAKWFTKINVNLCAQFQEINTRIEIHGSKKIHRSTKTDCK